MNNSEIYKRLYKDYSKKYINKILISVFFGVLVAASTSAIAWLLDPAIKKIFVEKDQSLIFIIPLLIIIAFTIKGFALYFAKAIMIKVAEEIKKILLELSNENKNIYLFDPYKEICKEINICQMYRKDQDLLLFKDTDHLTVEGSTYLSSDFKIFLKDVLSN